MCKVLKVPRSTYYASFNKELSKRSKETAVLEKEITKIYYDSNRRYGAPKVHKILLGKDFDVSIKRVQRIMKRLGLRSIVTKKFRPTRSNNKIQNKVNILNQNFETDKINEKWAGDITYIYTLKNGWCYLAVVLDLCSKKVIGHSFGKVMDSDLVVAALDNAYTNQRPEKGTVIFHSDLGVQYISSKFINRLEFYGITPSNSRKGCPYDNACIESFNSILKKERVNHVKYNDYESAKLDIFMFIEGWYNRKRIHSSIGYITPQQKEDMYL